MLANPSKHDVPFITRLTELAGEDIACQLCHEYGATSVYLPFQVWLPPQSVEAIGKHLLVTILPHWPNSSAQTLMLFTGLFSNIRNNR